MRSMKDELGRIIMITFFRLRAKKLWLLSR